MIEVKKPENVVKYIVYGLIVLIISQLFILAISLRPSIKISFEDNLDGNYRIRIKNVGNMATEELQFRILYVTNCAIGIDEVELKLLNQTKKDFTGEYNDLIHTKKWIITGVEINPGVEFSLFCQQNQPVEIRASGSNFKEIVKTKIN
ncbi:hypothetical protein HYW76_02665 [Candidatus Pacearchaeota archaeon]|nr:hypothetical protein [Candidatus Pacearchaeota archaeon]